MKHAVEAGGQRFNTSARRLVRRPLGESQSLGETPCRLHSWNCASRFRWVEGKGRAVWLQEEGRGQCWCLE